MTISPDYPMNDATTPLKLGEHPYQSWPHTPLIQGGFIFGGYPWLFQEQGQAHPQKITWRENTLTPITR